MSRICNARATLGQQWRHWMPMLLIASWMTTSSGCATRVTVIPSDKAVVSMPAGKSFVPPTDGFFVPQARMLQILRDQADALKQKK